MRPFGQKCLHNAEAALLPITLCVQLYKDPLRLEKPPRLTQLASPGVSTK